MLNKAIILATSAHDGQFRKHSKLPFIVHPLEVMSMLYRIGVTDEEVLSAAVLHDTLEDTSVMYDEIVMQTNKRVADIVVELTYNGNSHVEKAEYLNSFGTKSIPALSIKCIDRICNVLDFYKTDKEYARKYLFKARGLFKAFYPRMREFDENVFDGIDWEYDNVCKLLNSDL